MHLDFSVFEHHHDIRIVSKYGSIYKLNYLPKQASGKVRQYLFGQVSSLLTLSFVIEIVNDSNINGISTIISLLG
jgi:hypothetical protein